MRDDSFSDGMSDYILLVSAFIDYVKDFEGGEIRAYERWRSSYISQRVAAHRKAHEETAKMATVEVRLLHQ